MHRHRPRASFRKDETNHPDPGALLSALFHEGPRWLTNPDTGPVISGIQHQATRCAPAGQELAHAT